MLISLRRVQTLARGLVGWSRERGGHWGTCGGCMGTGLPRPNRILGWDIQELLNATRRPPWTKAGSSLGSDAFWFVVTAFMRYFSGPDESGHYERRKRHHYRSLTPPAQAKDRLPARASPPL